MHEHGRLLALPMQQLHTADPVRSFLGNCKMEAHFFTWFSVHIKIIRSKVILFKARNTTENIFCNIAFARIGGALW